MKATMLLFTTVAFFAIILLRSPHIELSAIAISEIEDGIIVTLNSTTLDRSIFTASRSSWLVLYNYTSSELFDDRSSNQTLFYEESWKRLAFEIKGTK